MALLMKFLKYQRRKKCLFYTNSSSIKSASLQYQKQTKVLEIKKKNYTFPSFNTLNKNYFNKIL